MGLGVFDVTRLCERILDVDGVDRITDRRNGRLP